jgi:hypothetical protein
MANETKVVKLKVPAAKVVPIKEAEQPPEETVEGFPEQIKVGHLFYNVRPMDQLEMALSGNLGHCDDQNLEIAVAENMPDQHKVEVLLHEILHALFESTSLRHDESLQEERVVTALAKGLVGLLIDNPDLIPWMAKNHPGIKLP